MFILILICLSHNILLATGVTDDPPVFGIIQREPQLESAPLADDGISTEASAPAFPMFQFTSSMEKTETESTAEPQTTTAETTTEQKLTETTAEVTQTEAEEQSTDDSSTISSTIVAATEDETTAVTDGSAGTTNEEEKSCDSFECQNNGTCVEQSDGSPKCKCAEGFGGEHCEKDLCAELGCQNGGKCHIRNGRAVCSCPNGIHGEKCHQMQPTCNPPCENEGVCSLIQNQPMCKCSHGFLGSNCNLRDLCANDATCGIYGQDAKCFKEAADLFRYSPVLQDATYSCQCPTGNGYAECNSTLSSQERLASQPFASFSTPPPLPRVSPDSFRTSASTGDFSPPTSFSVETSAATSDVSSQQPTQQSAELNGAQFPIHSTAVATASNVDSLPTIHHVIGASPEEEQTTSDLQFPLTSLTPELIASNSPTILPRPSSQSVSSSQPTTTAQFTRLPDLTFLASTLSSVPIDNRRGDENEGDSGFERMTQFIAEITTVEPTISQETTNRNDGEVGPEHSIEGNGSSNEVPPEFHTVAPPTATNPTSSVSESEDEEVETPPPFSIGPTSRPTDAAEGNADAEKGERTSGSWQWIVALVIVGILLIAATIGGIFMGRYVRRSRRLHGKYNPAREENAAIAHSTFAMPMATVNHKDERLI
ncbi:Abnormal pharyngeal pumping eat-20 [Aphelenchoides besseyi]|nr:Abnormal pharyngeal pumping eat-20 [Aphelenchoides besseyi]KAI6210140.1 Abnormal pharyngeal pumping eat-20 [Aphelenchoides besseyi]